VLYVIDVSSVHVFETTFKERASRNLLSDNQAQASRKMYKREVILVTEARKCLFEMISELLLMTPNLSL
jgi:hypothetical protein